MTKKLSFIFLFILLGSLQAEDMQGVQNPVERDMMKRALTQQRNNAFEKTMQNIPDNQQKQFWAIYESYAAEKSHYDDQRIKYLDQYKSNYMLLTEAQTKELMTQWIRLQQQELNSRIKTYRTLLKKTSPLVAMRFYQVDDYVQTAIKYNTLRQYPLLGDLPN